MVSLLGDEEQVLAIPIDDASTCHLASCLGASLKAGYKMYPYLQGLYKPANISSDHKTNGSTAHTGPNKHGMVYIKEKTSHIKCIQEQKDEVHNMTPVNQVPREMHPNSNQNDYLCVRGGMENDTVDYCNSYNFQEAPLPTLSSHARHYHTSIPGYEVCTNGNF